MSFGSQILFTVAIATAFGMAIFQTLSFKRRKQQNDIDSLIMFKFLINCCSTMGTVLFCSAAFLTVYVYFVYKTQHVVKVLPPFSELRLIKCFFIFAFILKVEFCCSGFIFHFYGINSAWFYRRSNSDIICLNKSIAMSFLSIGNGHESLNIKLH